jgi:hypothetical protein
MSCNEQEAVDILKALMKFRWKYMGYEALACISCGAIASEHEGKIRNIDKCSLHCPWYKAEVYLKELQ